MQAKIDHKWFLPTL